MGEEVSRRGAEAQRGAIDIDALTGRVVDTAIRIHRALGPGLLETVYETVLADSLSRAGLAVERQKPIGFEFEGRRFDDAFRADLLVEGCLIIEVKSVEKNCTSPRQAIADLFAPDGSARRAASQFWGRGHA